MRAGRVAIDAAMQRGLVLRAATLWREEQAVMTASRDKRARVWPAASGELLRLLRPPIGLGEARVR